MALIPSRWGRGLATEAVGPIVEHGLSDGVTFAILGTVDEPNARSRRLMLRCGFHELGRIAGRKYAMVAYETALSR